MIRGFAIKKTIYQGADGVQVDSLQEVKTFDNKKEAEIAAANCNGRVVNVVRSPKRPRKPKPSRGNQSWMQK